MKFVKTLSAAAVSAALLGATAASAADVTLYGIVDEGLIYNHTRTTDGDKTSSTNSFSERSGLLAPSRWGMRGVEELGNGLKVGFKLESGFNADTGTLGQNNRLFGRESMIYLSGDFGKLAAGRMGGVGSSAGTFDLVYGIADVSDGGWDNMAGQFYTSRYDNMLTYQTPKFAGLQATVQYGFKTDSTDTTTDGDEGTAKATRYYSGALTYEVGNFQAVAAYEYVNLGNDSASLTAKTTRRNYQIAHLGGNYDFGFTKVFGLVQYGDGASAIAGFDLASVKKALGTSAEKAQFDGFKGWGAELGAATPVCGGSLLTALFYSDFETQNVFVDGAKAKDVDGKFYGVNVQYNYPLSKRTHVYVGAAYSQSKLEGDVKQKSESSQGYVGLAHFF